PALTSPAGVVYLLSEPWGIAHGARTRGTTLPARAARGRAPAPPGGALYARNHLVLLGRLCGRLDAPGTRDHPYRPSGVVGPWGRRLGFCSLDAVVPGLSRAGGAAQSGGSRPGSGARASREARPGPPLCGLPASPPPRAIGGPGAGRGPHDPRDCTELSALGGVW